MLIVVGVVLLAAASLVWVTFRDGGTRDPVDTGQSPSPAGSSAEPVATSASPTALAAAPSVPPGGHTLTFVNAVEETIWLATTKDAAHPLPATGWVLAPGQRLTLVVPAHYGGRFWGRTGCHFDAAGRGRCDTGDCGGRFQCAGSGATPATLAELTLDAWNDLDFYDVSMVDGSNLPMYINVLHGSAKDPVSATGCVAAGCTRPVACPEAMRVAVGGRVVACRNPCDAFGTDEYCCRNAWAGREHCLPERWPVNYTKVFKDAEPYAYSYAFDDSATMSCRGDCDYRVTFGVTR